MKVQALTPEAAQYLGGSRLEYCMQHRAQFEPNWRRNEEVIGRDRNQRTDDISLMFSSIAEIPEADVDRGDSDIGVNYVFKYTRFFHSQLSANPPSVIARPTSSDPQDRRKADAADRISRWINRDKDMQEVVDQALLDMLHCGNGWLKAVWDPNRGDVFDFNEETSELTMEGDIHLYSPNYLSIWIDPDARRWADVRYVFEQHVLPLEEAILKFPDHVEVLKTCVLGAQGTGWDSWRSKGPDNPTMQKVVFYEYYEAGAPINGMAGRRWFQTKEGRILGEIGPNPHPHAKLPYHLMTYVDVPNQVYGKSVAEYATRLQEMLNALDSSMLDALQAHSVARLLIPSGTELEDESITDSNLDLVKYQGSQPPTFLKPMQLPNDSWQYRQQLVTAIQELYGVNDAMMGIQRREQSAVSQQTSIEAGTMIHRRVFKKYAGWVESIYRSCLGMVRDNWTVERSVLVLGKEKALEAVDIKGADIAGGFDIIVEYGASLPLDPNMRREAIMLLLPTLEKAGITTRQVLKFLKLNELEAIYDRMEMAADRQREIFEEMVARHEEGFDSYIEPQELEEHQGMLDYAYDYRMGSEFKYLPQEAKDLIERHIKEREAMSAQSKAPAPGAPQPAAPAGPGALPPIEQILGSGQ